MRLLLDISLTFSLASTALFAVEPIDYRPKVVGDQVFLPNRPRIVLPRIRVPKFNRPACAILVAVATVMGRLLVEPTSVDREGNFSVVRPCEDHAKERPQAIPHVVVLVEEKIRKESSDLTRKESDIAAEQAAMEERLRVAEARAYTLRKQIAETLGKLDEQSSEDWEEKLRLELRVAQGNEDFNTVIDICKSLLSLHPGDAELTSIQRAAYHRLGREAGG
jgi:hypothetical protein